MPIYDYSCAPCSRRVQIWCEISEIDEQTCEICQEPLQKMVSVFAKTPNRWGDSNGYFDRGLGCYVANSMERERIMKEKNLRPVSEEELDDHQQEMYNDKKDHEKKVQTFQHAIKKTGSFAKAAAAITPDPDPDSKDRDWRYEFEKAWKPDLKVKTTGEEE